MAVFVATGKKFDQATLDGPDNDESHQVEGSPGEGFLPLPRIPRQAHRDGDRCIGSAKGWRRRRGRNNKQHGAGPDHRPHDASVVVLNAGPCEDDNRVRTLNSRGSCQ